MIEQPMSSIIVLWVGVCAVTPVSQTLPLFNESPDTVDCNEPGLR